MSSISNDSPRWKIWPVIFLLCALALIWYMATHADNMGEAALILGGVLLLAGIAQRIAFYMRHGRPRLTK